MKESACKDKIRETVRSAFLRETNPAKLKECQVADGCSKQAVQGHLIPRSYMKRLPGNSSEMCVFTRYRFGAGRPPTSFPMAADRGVATTAFFTCHEHEALFYDADKINHITVKPKQKTLNAMCYRNLIHQRWQEKLWAQASEIVDRRLGMPKQRAIARLMRADASRLLPLQRALESCLLNPDCKDCAHDECRTMEHMVWAAEGPPVIAAAQFRVGANNDRDGLWGMTLIPAENCNALCLHFPKKLGTKPLDMAFDGTANVKKMHGRTITRAILSCCTNVVFSKESWEGLTNEERSAVVRSMKITSVDSNLNIDLFKGSHWTLL